MGHHGAPRENLGERQEPVAPRSSATLVSIVTFNHFIHFTQHLTNEEMRKLDETRGAKAVPMEVETPQGTMSSQVVKNSNREPGLRTGCQSGIAALKLDICPSVSRLVSIPSK